MTHPQHGELNEYTLHVALMGIQYLYVVHIYSSHCARDGPHNPGGRIGSPLRAGVFLSPEGDTETGKAVLRGYINATIDVEGLAKETGKDPKSLMRMLSFKGNPRANNLFAIIHHLQKSTGVHLAVQAGA